MYKESIFLFGTFPCDKTQGLECGGSLNWSCSPVSLLCSSRVLQRALAFVYLADLLCLHSLSSQAEDVVKKKPRGTAEVSGRKCQQTLAELESVLGHVEGLFA